MGISLELNDTNMTELWDFGWFDVSRFLFRSTSRDRPSDAEVLAQLLKNPLYQRSFCSGGPWGEKTETHGPFRVERLSVPSFQQVPSSEIAGRFQAVLESKDFSEPPDPEQLKPVNNWIQRMVSFCATAYLIDLSMCRDDQLEWSYVWSVFREVICINTDQRKIEIAVIGYD
jgi:hypothetical protein